MALRAPARVRSRTGHDHGHPGGRGRRRGGQIEESEMGKFVIPPHFRLHEWVAEEKGYFAAEGPRLRVPRARAVHATAGPRPAATRSAPTRRFEEGRAANVSCACHWTVNVAASAGHGKLYRRRLLGRAGGYLRARRVADPRRRRTWPACRSRSATSRAATTRRSRRSSRTCRASEIKLSFADGILFRRHGAADRPQGAGRRAVQRPVLLRSSSSASARSSTPPS